jgi:hypothetical protein
MAPLNTDVLVLILVVPVVATTVNWYVGSIADVDAVLEIVTAIVPELKLVTVVKVTNAGGLYPLASLGVVHATVTLVLGKLLVVPGQTIRTAPLPPKPPVQLPPFVPLAPTFTA